MRMVRALRAEIGTERGTVPRVASQLRFRTESARLWVRQADIDDGRSSGAISSESARLCELEQENREWRRARTTRPRPAPRRDGRSATGFLARRAKRVGTTKADPTSARHPDLVRRDFTADAPNRLWVTDLTSVPTWAGVAYVCFITDVYSRMIVGWRGAGHMRTETVLDAIEMARWSRGTRIDGLRCHSDAGSPFTSIRYGERLAEIGATPSIGTVADSYDNTLAETVDGYDKTELIRGPARSGPWRTVEDIELATLGWVQWHNTQRLHGYLGDVPPAEFEATFYATHGTDQTLVEIPWPEPPSDPGRFTSRRRVAFLVRTWQMATRVKRHSSRDAVRRCLSPT